MANSIREMFHQNVFVNKELNYLDYRNDRIENFFEKDNQSNTIKKKKPH